MTDRYQTRTVRLDTPERKRLFIAAVENAPAHVEGVIREPVKSRKLDQNALYWAGPLKDLAEQAWINGRTYSAEVWHEQCKRDFLPDDDDPMNLLDEQDEYKRQVKSPETYLKWAITPRGDRVLIGSTTDLTVYGFSLYLEQIYALGASLGVMFSASPR